MRTRYPLFHLPRNGDAYAVPSTLGMNTEPGYLGIGSTNVQPVEHTLSVPTKLVWQMCFTPVLMEGSDTQACVIAPSGMDSSQWRHGVPTPLYGEENFTSHQLQLVDRIEVTALPVSQGCKGVWMQDKQLKTADWLQTGWWLPAADVKHTWHFKTQKHLQTFVQSVRTESPFNSQHTEAFAYAGGINQSLMHCRQIYAVLKAGYNDQTQVDVCAYLHKDTGDSDLRETSLGRVPYAPTVAERLKEGEVQLKLVCGEIEAIFSSVGVARKQSETVRRLPSQRLGVQRYDIIFSYTAIQQRKG